MATEIRDEDLDPGDLVFVRWGSPNDPASGQTYGIWVLRPAVPDELPYGSATTSGWVGRLPGIGNFVFGASAVVSVIKANKKLDKNDLGPLVFPPVPNPIPGL